MRLFPLGSLVLAALAFTLPVGPARAQEPEPATDGPFGETVEVRVVNVDVTVTDRDGNPVYGLSREDFEILEDGEPQEITNFYRVEGTRLRADDRGDWETIRPDSSFRRRILLLVDNNFIETPQRNQAVAALEEYLDQKFDGSYEWGVVSVGDDVQVLEPFTSDKLRVRAALDRIKRQPTFGNRYRIERNFLNDPLRVRRSQRSAGALGGNPAEDDSGFQTALRFESKFNIASTLQAFQRTAGAMLQTFRTYANLPGNKVLIWITGGVPMLPEYAFTGEVNNPTGAPSSRDTALRLYQNELRKVADSIAFEANAAQFKVYPVKATGVRPQIPQSDPSFRSSGATFSEMALNSAPEVDDSDSAQLSVALGTGGLYLTSNRTVESFEEVDRDTTGYYSIGYRPTRDEDGGFHRVQVKIRQPGLEARSRRGYVDLSREQRLEMALTTPLAFPRERGTLPVQVDVSRGAGRDVLATVHLPNDQLTFLPQGDDYVGRVKIYLTIHDQAGNFVDLVSQEQDLRFPAQQQPDVMAGEFRYGLRFKLKDRGRYVVSVTLRDEATQEIGTAFSNFEI